MSAAITAEGTAAARAHVVDLVGRAATLFGLDLVEVGSDSWVLQYYGQPPAIGPVSLAEMLLYVLKDFVVREEFEVFGDAIDPGSAPSMTEVFITALEREDGEMS